MIEGACRRCAVGIMRLRRAAAEPHVTWTKRALFGRELGRDPEAMPKVEGASDSRFAAVEDAFQRNFEDLGEVGAALCVTPLCRHSVWGVASKKQ